MTETEHNTATPEPGQELDWTSRKMWGSEGRTHTADVTVARRAWTFMIRQPRKGYWIVSGWAEGASAFFGEDTTLKGAKAQVQEYVGFLAVQEARETAAVPEADDLFDAPSGRTEPGRNPEDNFKGCSPRRAVCGYSFGLVCPFHG